PTAAPLLVSLLGGGRGSELFEAARQGLSALGDAATTELLRAANSPQSRARREAALLLSQRGVPHAVPVLLALLTEDPEDSLIASELAVTTCADLRGGGNPATSWWDWWEGVVHDEPNAWLCGALERLAVAAPDPKDLAAPGTRAGLRFLVTVMRRPESHLAERARRDLGRLLGRELGPLPTVGDDRNAFLAGLEREIGERFPQ
ncbi:MAG TPA: HEAT repeat domain-containing protein, partial [Planctomycetota bacterium]|nr:HEAT repeat domain-containing protein [Planctomycetota bacterium]